MFQARVLVGEYTPGNSSMRMAPNKPNSNRPYDSVSNAASNATVFVIFHDSQAYPEYLISFQMSQPLHCNDSRNTSVYWKVKYQVILFLMFLCDSLYSSYVLSEIGIHFADLNFEFCFIFKGIFLSLQLCHPNILCFVYLWCLCVVHVYI